MTDFWPTLAAQFEEAERLIEEDRMSDEEWKEMVRQITDPREMLRVIVENERYFGRDPYYSDLRQAMIDQADKLSKGM